MFRNFLYSLKRNDNQELIQSILEGYNVLFEEQLSLFSPDEMKDPTKYYYHETKKEHIRDIQNEGLIPTSYGQSFVNGDTHELMSPEDFSEEELENMPEEDAEPRTYFSEDEQKSSVYGDGIFLRFPKDAISSIEVDVDYFTYDAIPPENIEIKTNEGWKNILSVDLNESILEAVQSNVLDNPNFKRWFGNSKIVDKQGKPLVVYHGTRSDFAEFKTPTSYFSDTPYNPESGGEGRNYMPVYLSIQNPKVMENRKGFVYNDEIKELKNQGYDGIIQLPGTYDTQTHYISFEPNQIKSAIGNKGSFNKISTNITESAKNRKSHISVLKDNKIPLTDDEREKVMKAGAVWHHGPNGEESPAIWKSKNPNTGEITYITNTHRAYNTRKSLSAIINAYHNFIKETA